MKQNNNERRVNEQAVLLYLIRVFTFFLFLSGVIHFLDWILYFLLVSTNENKGIVVFYLLLRRFSGEWIFQNLVMIKLVPRRSSNARILGIPILPFFNVFGQWNNPLWLLLNVVEADFTALAAFKAWAFGSDLFAGSTTNYMNWN